MEHFSGDPTQNTEGSDYIGWGRKGLLASGQHGNRSGGGGATGFAGVRQWAN